MSWLAICIALYAFFAASSSPIGSVGASDDDTITFAVIGDYGLAGDTELAVANLVKGWNPAFIVSTGDNNYSIGAASTIDQNIGQYYHPFISPYVGTFGPGASSNRFFPTLGNHDWATSGATPYLEYFTLPGNERYYDVVQGPVHLFAIDSDPHEPDGVSSSSVQANWVHDRVTASTACWQIAAFHHAPFSSSLHGSNAAMQWPFDAWGIDGVLAGHDHTYERLLVGGIPYFVNGLGGNPSRYAFGAPVAGSMVRYNASHGAMRIVASRTSLTYEFIAVDGTIIDTYVQTGGCKDAPTSTNTPLSTSTSTPLPTSTNTPLPTSTSTLTPTLTPTVTACQPRPQVAIATSRDGPGQLRVTVSPTGQGGPLKSIHVTETRNAVLNAPGVPSDAAGPLDVSFLPDGSPAFTFTVRRVVAQQAVHVQFTVEDACGPWKTFVGGGPGSF